MTGVIPRDRWGPVHTALVLAAIFRLTLWPDPGAVELNAHLPFLCILGCDGEPLRDLIQNVVLFLPIGWSLRRWHSLRVTVLTCLALTVFIEISQLWIPGRDSSLRDMLSNTLGGWLGALFAEHWRLALLPLPEASRQLGRWALAGVTALLLATGLLLHTQMPETIYYGQWKPDLGGLDIYPGQVLRVELNGRPVPDGARPDSPELREAILSDSFQVQVDVIEARAPERRASIFSIYDERHAMILMLARMPEGLEFQLRNRMTPAGLRGQLLWVPAYPGEGQPVPLRLTAGVVRHRYRIAVTNGTDSLHLEVPFSVAWGWSSLMPFGYWLGPWTRDYSAAWLALLLLPVAYWAGRSRRAREAGLLAALAALVLLLVPVVSGLPPLSPLEWIGGVAGMAGGLLVGRWSTLAAGADPSS